MPVCQICRCERPSTELDRMAEIDICPVCRATDPAPALLAQGLAVQWDVRWMWFGAGVTLPGIDPAFRLVCAPEGLHHKVIKLVLSELQVGDPLFDRHVYLRTSDARAAELVLSKPGVQAGILAFLLDVHPDGRLQTHVTLERSRLTVAARPLELLTPDRVLEYQLELAALALHLAS